MKRRHGLRWRVAAVGIAGGVIAALLGPVGAATAGGPNETSVGTGFGATISSGVVDWGYDVGRAWADVNGDGRADYCRRVGDGTVASPRAVRCTLSTGTAFDSEIVSGALDWGTAPAWADFDGDGRADYCRRVVGAVSSHRLSCTLSTGTGFGATITSPALDWGYEPGAAWADFNGDGKADYCRTVGDKNLVSSKLSCTLSMGTGFGATITSGLVDWGDETGRAWVDVNGDHRADYCRRVGDGTVASPHAVRCTLSTGTAFDSEIVSGALDWGLLPAWADFNGDGRADYCRRVGDVNAPSSHRVSCTLSTGTGFGATITSPVLDWGYEAGSAWVDFNGDHRADYCRTVGDKNLVSSELSCTLSMGNGFGATITSGVVDWGWETGRAWADFNADGKADYCRRTGDQNLVSSRVACTLST